MPEFLPFLMMSGRFMNRAVEISVGSLFSTINWKILKLEEFNIPPLEQQLVQGELRKTLLKYKLHTDQDLFDRAYAYIKQYN